MDDATMVRRSGAPLSTPVEGEIVMFHPDRGAYFRLGDVAMRIWELIETPTSVAAIVATLVGEYSVEPGVCRDEVAAFVTEMQGAGLVELAG